MHGFVDFLGSLHRSPHTSTFSLLQDCKDSVITTCHMIG